MIKPTVRLFALSAIAVASAAVVGCEVHVYGPPPPPPPAAVVYDGGVQVDLLPPPADRVYLYDPGYPPGCYSYGGYVYYHGYRYQHDVFVTHVVNVNMREHRYVDVQQNHARGHVLEESQRNDYIHNGGHIYPQGHPADHRNDHHDDDHH